MHVIIFDHAPHTSRIIDDHVFCIDADVTFLFTSDDAALKEKKKKDESKPPTRTPGMRDANKRQSKIVSVSPFSRESCKITTVIKISSSHSY